MDPTPEMSPESEVEVDVPRRGGGGLAAGVAAGVDRQRAQVINNIGGEGAMFGTRPTIKYRDALKALVSGDPDGLEAFSFTIDQRTMQPFAMFRDEDTGQHFPIPMGYREFAAAFQSRQQIRAARAALVEQQRQEGLMRAGLGELISGGAFPSDVADALQVLSAFDPESALKHGAQFLRTRGSRNGGGDVADAIASDIARARQSSRMETIFSPTSPFMSKIQRAQLVMARPDGSPTQTEAAMRVLQDERTLRAYQAGPGVAKFGGLGFVRASHMGMYGNTDPDEPIRRIIQAAAADHGVYQPVPKPTTPQELPRYLTALNAWTEEQLGWPLAMNEEDGAMLMQSMARVFPHMVGAGAGSTTYTGPSTSVEDASAVQGAAPTGQRGAAPKPEPRAAPDAAPEGGAGKGGDKAPESVGIALAERYRGKGDAVTVARELASSHPEYSVEQRKAALRAWAAKANVPVKESNAKD